MKSTGTEEDTTVEELTGEGVGVECKHESSDVRPLENHRGVKTFTWVRKNSGL